MIFGTDGIREIYGQGILTSPNITRLANALNSILNLNSHIVIIHDTRPTAAQIIQDLLRGFSLDKQIFYLGICPTGFMPLILQQGNFDFGIVITASHNPADYNGFKFFKKNGLKLTEAEITQINLYLEQHSFPCYTFEKITLQYSSVLEQIIQILSKKFEINYSKKIVFDCANGAAIKVLEQIIQKFQLNVVFKNTVGTINQDCGSLYPHKLVQYIQEEKAEIGFSFDGDADRIIMADQTGKIYDGDDLLYILATAYKIDTVVTTQLANRGLIETLKQLNIQIHFTPVGDHYILEKLIETQLQLGAEPSGHIIFHDFNLYFGDGIITVLRLLELLTDKISFNTFEKYPQISINLDIREKKDLIQIPEIAKFLNYLEKQLIDENGRYLIRYSGTELKLRIMLEGKNRARLESLAQELVTIIKKYE